MKTSWKTTLFGLIAAAAGGVAAANIDPVITKIATAVSSIAAGLIGFFARDHGVSSEQAGVK